MRIASNKVKDIVRFFHQELYGLYEKAEIQEFVVYCFEEFASICRHEITLKYNDKVSESELLKFNFAIKYLKSYKPIQYIIKKADFYGLKFCVNNHVLIPRPETEELVRQVIGEIGGRAQEKVKTTHILDIGTGSGCIAIALKKNIPDVLVHAMDISEEALKVASENAALNHLDILFLKQDILYYPETPLPLPQYDIIVSNPPYVRMQEKQQMSANVLNYEPSIALFVEDEAPLIFYEAIAKYAVKCLKKDGVIYVEINEYLSEETAAVFIDRGFENVNVYKDINAKNRILRASY